MPVRASRRRLWIGVWVAFLLVLSGCRPFGDAPAATSPAPSATATPSATPSGGVAAGTAETGSVAPLQSQPAPGGGASIVEGSVVEPRTLNPLFVADPVSEQLSHLVFDGLVSVDPVTAEPTPRLAESWEVSEDGLTYTFALRDDVVWHDGQPFTARDVVFTYDLMMNDRVRSPRYSRLVERIRRVTMLDSTTVQFELINPSVGFLRTLATFGIVPEHVLANVLPEELVTDPFGISSAVGTGPFVFQQWSRGEQIVFQRNDRYFQGAPAVDRYVFRVLRAPEDLVAGLQAGEIDWGVLDPGLIEQAKGLDGVTVDVLPSFDMTYVALQLDPSRTRLFEDPRVRQALMLALDRDRLVQDVWNGAARVANGTLPPASPAFRDAETTYRQNLEEARRLLDEAGWTVAPDGIRVKDGTAFRFTLTTNGDNPRRRAVADWLIRSWREVGIDVQPDYEKWSSVRERAVKTRDFDALLVGYRWDVDPDQTALWSSDSFFDAFNIGHYANSEVDDLLENALATTDAGERAELYAQVQERIMKDLPVLPLAFPDLVVARSASLQDVQVTAILVTNRANIERWVPAIRG